MDPTPNSGPADQPTHVFVSYAREDRKWLDPDYRHNLIPFLKESLRRQNVQFWDDKELKGGDEFRRYIEQQIDQSQIALLIVSQSFLNSEFIELHEMPRIADRAHLGQMIIVPVLVEPCDWSDYPVLADRQMVPGATPLIDYTESEAKWARVKAEILDGLKVQVKRIRTPVHPPVLTPPAPQLHKSEASTAASPAPAPVPTPPQVQPVPPRQGSAASHAMRARPQKQPVSPRKAEPQTQPKAPSGLTWTDPATGLMWTKNDNGRDSNWQEAMDYARNLRLDGYADWRLPTIDELQGIHDKDTKVPGRWGDGASATWYVKGNIQLTGFPWSSSTDSSARHAFILNFGKSFIYFGSSGERTAYALDSCRQCRALCVRRPTE